MDKEQFLSSGLMEQYVLRLTTPEENRLVEELLEKHPELRQEIEALEQSLDQYITSIGIPPPDERKDKQDINPTFGSNIDDNFSLNGFNVSWKFLAVISLLLLLPSACFFYRQAQSIHQKYEQLDTEYIELQAVCETQKTHHQVLALQNEILEDQHTQYIPLRGSELAPEGLALVYWNPQMHSAYISVINLPFPPQGKAYQLWADIDGKMVNMQTIDVQEKNLVKIPFLEQANSLNITLENIGEQEHATVSQLYINGEV